MTVSNALDTLLRSYQTYYNIARDGVSAPFTAEASFHSHSEQYFLVKSARLGQADSHEYVFFATADSLDEPALRLLDQAAWARGMERVQPNQNHRNTDVSLVILANSITQEARGLVKKLRHYRSYRFGLYGWSNYRVIAMETSSGRLFYNWHGRNLKGLFGNNFKKGEST